MCRSRSFVEVCQQGVLSWSERITLHVSWHLIDNESRGTAVRTFSALTLKRSLIEGSLVRLFVRARLAGLDESEVGDEPYMPEADRKSGMSAAVETPAPACISYHPRRSSAAQAFVSLTALYGHRLST
jgi:hypothetical protein